MRNDLGVVKSVGHAEDNEGRTVLRAIVDFYDGACPAITFEAIWSRIPVTIIEVRADALVAQGIEQPTSNRQVAGSFPAECATALTPIS